MQASRRQVKQTKLALLDVLVRAAREGKSVAGYGAPGKSATLLHYCGIGRDLIEYTVDRPLQTGAIPPGQPYPDLSSRPDSGNEARLRCDSALEFEGGNNEATAVYPRMGRAIRDTHSRQLAGRLSK